MGKKKWAYYNDIDPYCQEWIRNLIKFGLIMDGEVDGRSIVDVTPEELMGFERVHAFCGIAGWDRALNLAGWEGEVWTGSTPCQGFSTAGRGAGFADERHLWPYFFHLIRVCRPPVLLMEQVASKLALSWLDLVYDDLEAEGYACGSFDLPACSVGAPHIRQRLWFIGVDNSSGTGAGEQSEHLREGAQAVGEVELRDDADTASPTGLVAQSKGDFSLRASEPKHSEAEGQGGHDLYESGSSGGVSGIVADSHRCEPGGRCGETSGEGEEVRVRASVDSHHGGEAGELADPGDQGLAGREGERGDDEPQFQTVERDSGESGELADSKVSERRGTGGAPNSWGRLEEVGVPSTSFWTPCTWLPCRDGKWRATGVVADNQGTGQLREAQPEDDGTDSGRGRGCDPGDSGESSVGKEFRPTQSIIQPLAHGIPARVGKLRAAGNAIVAQTAAEVIKAYMEGR